MKLPAPVMYPTSAWYWVLAEPYQFTLGTRRFTAPRGWRTDGASIPRALWRVLGHPFAGDVIAAALAHDVLYATHYTTRAEADRLFYDRLLANGVGRVKAWSLYAGVRAGGWATWNSERQWAILAAREKVRVEIGVTDTPAKPTPDAVMDGAVALIAVLLCLLAVLATGCATVEFDPATGKAKYSRWGDQKVSLTVQRTGPEAWKLGLTQESEAAALTEMAKTINKLAELAGSQ